MSGPHVWFGDSYGPVMRYLSVAVPSFLITLIRAIREHARYTRRQAAWLQLPNNLREQISLGGDRVDDAIWCVLGSALWPLVLGCLLCVWAWRGLVWCVTTASRLPPVDKNTLLAELETERLTQETDGMRCPDCAKFVSYDTEVEPEEQSEPALSGCTFTASYRRVLTCENCSGELKESTFDLTCEVTVTPTPTAEGTDSVEWETCPHEWGFELEVTPSVATQTVDRRGKPITKHRYMKTLYGVEVEGTAWCALCHATAAISVAGTCPASAMDELT